MSEEFSSQEIMGTMEFVRRMDGQRLAEFIIRQNRAIDGLSENNRAFASEFESYALDRQKVLRHTDIILAANEATFGALTQREASEKIVNSCKAIRELLLDKRGEGE